LFTFGRILSAKKITDKFTAMCRYDCGRLTLQAVSIEQVFTLLVTLDATLRATHALPDHSPQEAATFEAVRGRSGGPHHEVVWCRAGDWVDQSLKSLLVYMHFLKSNINCKFIFQVSEVTANVNGNME
jgi:hypothetical protein